MGRGFAVSRSARQERLSPKRAETAPWSRAQDLRSLFLRVPAEGRERTLSRRSGSPRILLVARRYVPDYLGGRRTDEVHDLAGVGFNVCRRYSAS